MSDRQDDQPEGQALTPAPDNRTLAPSESLHSSASRLHQELKTGSDGSHSAVQVSANFRNSVLFDPNEVEHWEVLVPGAAERLLQMTEREQEHRHQLDDRYQELEYNREIELANKVHVDANRIKLLQTCLSFSLVFLYFISAVGISVAAAIHTGEAHYLIWGFAACATPTLIVAFINRNTKKKLKQEDQPLLEE